MIYFQRSLASRRSDGVATVRASSQVVNGPVEGIGVFVAEQIGSFIQFPEMSGAGSDGLIHGALRPVTAEP